MAQACSYQAYGYIVAQVIKNVNTFFTFFAILANIHYSNRGKLAGKYYKIYYGIKIRLMIVERKAVKSLGASWCYLGRAILNKFENLQIFEESG